MLFDLLGFSSIYSYHLNWCAKADIKKNMPFFMWIVLFLQLLWFQVPFLFGVPAFEKAAGLFIHWIFRRTGRHLFLTDHVDGKPPLLKRLVEDDGDCHFMYVFQYLTI